MKSTALGGLLLVATSGTALVLANSPSAWADERPAVIGVICMQHTPEPAVPDATTCETTSPDAVAPSVDMTSAPDVRAQPAEASAPASDQPTSLEASTVGPSATPPAAPVPPTPAPATKVQPVVPAPSHAPQTVSTTVHPAGPVLLRHVSSPVASSQRVFPAATARVSELAHTSFAPGSTLASPPAPELFPARHVAPVIAGSTVPPQLVQTTFPTTRSHATLAASAPRSHRDNTVTPFAVTALGIALAASAVASRWVRRT